MTGKYPQGGLLVFLKEGIPQRAVMIGKVQSGLEADPQSGLLVFWKKCFQRKVLQLSSVVVLQSLVMPLLSQAFVKP